MIAQKWFEWALENNELQTINFFSIALTGLFINNILYLQNKLMKNEVCHKTVYKLKSCEGLA